MDPIYFTNALVSFGAAFSGSALSKAEGPGRALDDIMALIGFERLHEVAERKRVQREQNILEYKESIAQNIARIPEDKLQDPPLSIVGPALEASKYHIEEEELREMFARLIAGSMNKSNNDKVHPSFVEIIKQLNSDEANMLRYIKGFRYRANRSYPVIQIVKVSPNGDGHTVMHPIIFLYPPTSDNFLKNSPYVENLDRLSIVNISFASWFTDNDNYLIYTNHPELSNIMSYNHELQINNGIMRLTDFGNNFLSVCVH